MANVSVLNTTNQLSGKTVAVCENDQTISGAWTFTGNQAFQGNVTIGNAVGDTLTVTSTIVSNLLFTDATYDIGASGATRPRDLFLSRNAVVGGTLGVTGVATLTAQAVLNGGATFAGHLIATDATYDIGASGATRFRDLFLSRNAVVGGTLGVTGVATLTAQAVMTAAFQTGAANAYINDTSNANMTVGLTINQGAADDEILAFKSSDVAHGMTSIAETDTWGLFKKYDDAAGGIFMRGLTESAVAVRIDGLVTTDNADRSTAANAPIRLHAHLNNGAGGTQDMSANKNLLVIVNGASTARFIFDSDGDSHQDVGTAWTNFDSHDDALVLDSLALEVSRPDDPWKDAIRQNMAESLDEMIPRQTMQDMKLVQFNEDGHHFVNMSKLTMLHTGAIRQLARRNRALEVKIETMERKLLKEAN